MSNPPSQSTINEVSLNACELNSRVHHVVLGTLRWLTCCNREVAKLGHLFLYEGVADHLVRYCINSSECYTSIDSGRARLGMGSIVMNRIPNSQWELRRYLDDNGV